MNQGHYIIIGLSFTATSGFNVAVSRWIEEAQDCSSWYPIGEGWQVDDDESTAVKTTYPSPCMKLVKHQK